MSFPPTRPVQFRCDLIYVGAFKQPIHRHLKAWITVLQKYCFPLNIIRFWSSNTKRPGKWKWAKVWHSQHLTFPDTIQFTVRLSDCGWQKMQLFVHLWMLRTLLCKCNTWGKGTNVQTLEQRPPLPSPSKFVFQDVIAAEWCLSSLKCRCKIPWNTLTTSFWRWSRMRRDH